MWITLNDAVWKAKMPSTHKLVALAIASYFNDAKSECFASEATLAEMTGVSKRSVIRSVKWMADRKILLVKHKLRPGSRWPTNHYQFTNEIKRIGATQSPSDTMSPTKPDGVTTCPSTGDTQSQKG